MSFVFLFLACLLSGSAQANVGQTYGFGSESAALAGAGAGVGFDAFSSYYNPAALALDHQSQRLRLAYGLIFVSPKFTGINGVVVENKFVSDKETIGNVDNNYRDTLGQVIGLSYRLFPETRNFTFGLTIFLPLLQVGYMDTGETFVPEYFMYRARTQRPQIEVGLGLELTKSIRAGFGAHIAFGLSSNATVFINTQSNRTSTMRFTSTLTPKASPYFGLHFVPQDDPEKYSAGLVYRLPLSATNNMTLNTGARVFGSFAALDFNFQAASALFYDPMSIELGGSIRHGSWGRLIAQVDYQFWSQFVAPALKIEQPSITCTDQYGTACNSGIVLSPGQNPTFTYVNILVPRIGEELRLSELAKLRVGYSYRASILKDLPEGAGNYLDPPRHAVSLGLGLHFKKFLSAETPWDLDFHASWDHLVSQTITKTPGLENGDTTANKIGYPGYTTGGNLFGGGVSVSLTF